VLPALTLTCRPEGRAVLRPEGISTYSLCLGLYSKSSKVDETQGDGMARFTGVLGHAWLSLPERTFFPPREVHSQLKTVLWGLGLAAHAWLLRLAVCVRQ